MSTVSRAVAPRRPPSPRRLARRRRRWPLLLAVAPIAAWLAVRALDDPAPSAALAATTAPPGSTLVAFDAPTGSRTTDARCWMIVIDESSSMAASDAAGTRADAVRATAEFLAAYGLDGDRIGVTWFADRADVQPPAAAASVALGSRPRTPVGSGTRIAAALDETAAAMDRSCGDTDRVAVLVSDGQATSADDFDAIARLVADSGIGVHLIAMNGDGTFDTVRPSWDDPAIGVRSIREITSFGGDEVADAVAAILSAETGQQVTAR